MARDSAAFLRSIADRCEEIAEFHSNPCTARTERDIADRHRRIAAEIERLRALNERLIWSLTGDEVPEIWRVEWLRSLLDAFAEGKAVIQDDEDPAATIQALAECRALVDDATATLAAARQEPSHG